MQGKNTSPVTRILKLVQLEKNEISTIYFYATLKGLILLAIPVGVQSLVGFAQTNTASSSIVLLIILVVVSVFIGGVLQVKQMQITEKIQQKIFVRYSFNISKIIPKLQLQTIDNYYLPELINRFFDIINLQKSLAKLLLDFPLAIIQIIFGLLLLAFYHPTFIAFGILLAIVIWGILYFSGTKGLERSIKESNEKYKVAGWLEEMSRTVRSIKFSNSPEFLLKKTDDHVTNYLKERTGHFKILELQFKTLVAFKTLVTSAMLIVGTFLLLKQQLNVGQFIAAEIVILTIINSVEKLISNLDGVYDVLTAVEKIEKITDKEIEHSGTIILPKNEEGLSISLSQLSYKYIGADKNILTNISFAINANEKICITGDEGSGKSTLLHLLSGSYQNFEGAILINNIPLQNYNLQSLRLQTGVLFSQQDIFEGTLLENICMGAENVDFNDIKELCAKTGLSEYFITLKNGFDTNIFASGRKLPSSVVKKILLVRALVNKPKLLLLEEPWQGLPEKNQEDVKKLLLKEFKNTTIVVVTNDKAFAANCNRVIELTNNKI